MCGICGIVGRDGAPLVNPTVLERMNRAMTPRGPDQEGTFVAGPIGLGAAALDQIQEVRAAEQRRDEHARGVVEGAVGDAEVVDREQAIVLVRRQRWREFEHTSDVGMAMVEWQEIQRLAVAEAPGDLPSARQGATRSSG